MDIASQPSIFDNFVIKFVFILLCSCQIFSFMVLLVLERLQPYLPLQKNCLGEYKKCLQRRVGLSHQYFLVFVCNVEKSVTVHTVLFVYSYGIMCDVG